MMNSSGDLAIRAEHCLHTSPYRALRAVTCEQREGVIVLNGVVSSYYLKQLAQETLRTLEGIEKISNVVEVKIGTNGSTREILFEAGNSLYSGGEVDVSAIPKTR